uniref:Uncharacterized protein n=1 Tax=Anguilla anguilla TaxID=7936 RepID=A0A0E9S534_ANGAN
MRLHSLPGQKETYLCLCHVTEEAWWWHKG